MKLTHIEEHGQGFSAALRMPNHAAFALPAFTSSLNRRGQRSPYRMELVIACQLLRFDHAIGHFKCRVIKRQVKQPRRVERTPDEHFQFGPAKVVMLFAVDGSPRLETV